MYSSKIYLAVFLLFENNSYFLILNNLNSNRKAVYNKIVEIGLKQYSKMFLVNICPTLPETESHSPGLSGSIDLYNSAIYEIMDNYKGEESLKLIDINSILLQQSDLKKYILPDGHHIFPSTHQLIFEEIIKHFNE